MTIQTEAEELNGIINRLCDAMGVMVQTKGDTGSEMRRKIGDLRVNALSWLNAKTFAAALLDCFRVAREIPVKQEQIENIRLVMEEEQPSGLVGTMVVQTAVFYCLSTESRLAAAIDFKSRDDAEAMMQKMHVAFDAARESAADAMDSATYQNLSYLAGSLTNHLASRARQLPRVVTFEFAENMPSLTMANLIYHDATRAEELADENKTIHPLFMQRTVVGISS